MLKKYLDMMDGNEVTFDGEYGTVTISRSFYAYPIYKEWCMEGQMHISDYINRIDGRKVTAYKCEDKDWYVIHGITNDWYQMEQKRAFESTYDRIYRTEGI